MRSVSPVSNSEQDLAVAGFDLELSYREDTVLCCTDFRIPRGALTVLIGSNGSGKSTLLNAIAGIIEPVRGSLVVLGQAPGSDKSTVSYVLQVTADEVLLPVTVREIVMMGRFAYRGLLGRINDSDRRAVESAIMTMELDSVANSRLSELSVGQRQRALIAQGIAQEAEILLLDEPMNGLDIVSRERTLDMVQREKLAGRTVVMASHDLDEARLADHVILLAGRVVAEGEPSDVLTAGNLGEAYGKRYLSLGAQDGIVDDHHHHG